MCRRNLNLAWIDTGMQKCNIPNLTQRGKFRGREFYLLNYNMNTMFSYFPYQYKSILNKYLFCIENLFFIIPNQNYLRKTGACSIILGYSPIWGHSVSLCVTYKPSSTSANPNYCKPSSA